jgi:ADP-ribosylglycohydrolase
MKLPIPNSYWVEPGRLLAGEHPHGGNPDATRARIADMLAAGVRHFIDLTEPRELPSYSGHLPDGVSYASFALPDHDVPRTTESMRAVQLALERCLAAGGGVYVHCRAGIGRTGMAIGCYLREQGEPPHAALSELNRLWQQNARAAQWLSIPETEEQEQYILDWQPHPLNDTARVGNSGMHWMGIRPLLRFRGSLIGTVVGDALAAQAADSTDLAWTDVAGLALCVAESLCACNGFDGRDQLQRYRVWAQDPVAAGAKPGTTPVLAVRNVLARTAAQRAAPQGSHDPASADVTALARCVAPAMFAMGKTDLASSVGGDVARVVHQAPVLVDACRLLCAMTTAALGGAGRDEVLHLAASFGGLPLRSDVFAMAADWSAPSVGRRRPLQGVLGVMDRAVRCYAKSSNFQVGMERALAARSADRAVICTVYGALAGAHFGEEGIPTAWRDPVVGRGRVRQLADQLFERASANAAAVA